MLFFSQTTVRGLLSVFLLPSLFASPTAPSSPAARLSQQANVKIRLIAPSSGCPPSVWERIKATFPNSFEQPFNIGNSPDQIKANPKKKFERLDKELKGTTPLSPKGSSSSTASCPKTVLWALRGGYGLGKIMPYIVSTDYSKEEPKMIVGYSDTTVLLNYFAQTYGWKGLHACCLRELCLDDKSPQTREKVVPFLLGQSQTLTLPHLKPLNAAARQAKRLEGLSAGGNITLLVDSLGTPWAFKGDQKILFLEDVNVQNYALDRLLTHLNNAGVFRCARAIVFGQVGSNNQEVIRTFAKDLPIPVYQTPTFGHGNDNYPIGIHFKTIIEPSPQSAEFSVRMRP